MARPHKIRAAGLEGEVRKLAAKGLTCRQIAEGLQQKGLKVSHVAVSRFLNEETTDRREAARSVAAGEAQRTVPLVTGKLTKWVKEIDRLIDDTLEARRDAIIQELKEEDPSAKLARRERSLSGASEDLARLVNAGTKAAKTLHDITVGDGPADAMSALRDQAIAILAAKRKRETDDEP